MYTVLLVEDEEMIRKAIKKVIPWNELGFQLIGEMENGKETIEFLEDKDVDVIITDICMPFVDGLELTKYIRDKNMKTEILIITGHDDFEYAKQALTLGVYDYILKPITAKEFSEVLIKLKEKLDEENKYIEYMKTLHNKYQKTIKAVQEVFLKELLIKEMDEEIVEKKLKELSLFIPSKNYQVAVLNLGHNLRDCKLSIENNFDLQTLHFAVENIIQEVLYRYNKTWKILNMGENIFSIIFIQTKEEELEFDEAVTDSLNSIIKNLENSLDIKISIGLGKKEKNFSKIYLSYEEALTAIEYQVILGSGKIIKRSEIKGESISIHEEILPLFDKLEYSLKFGNKEDVDRVLEGIFKTLSEAPIKISIFKSILLKLLTCILNTSDEIIFDKDKKIEMKAEWIENMFSKSKMVDILAMYKDLCHGILTRASIGQKNEGKEKVKQACLYIKENFSNPNLCVQELCNYLYVSPSYFSKTFKEVTEKTFLEYLNYVRLEESIKLLIYTDLHSYEIAYKCGFKDPQYFSQWFKRKTEFTPKQYRDKIVVQDRVGYGV